MKRFIPLLFVAGIVQAEPVYYAEVAGRDDLVMQVIVVDGGIEIGPDGQHHEALGMAWCESQYGGMWIKAFTDGMRKHYPGPGFTYNAGIDAFVPPKPYKSWVLDEIGVIWNAPVPKPADGKIYYWDEDSGSWKNGENQ